jgi:hypothetical protein
MIRFPILGKDLILSLGRGQAEKRGGGKQREGDIAKGTSEGGVG